MTPKLLRTGQMLLGLNDLGQSWELLGSQNLRVGESMILSHGLQTGLGDALIPSTFYHSHEQCAVAHTPPWPHFLLSSLSPVSVFEFGSGAWKHGAWIKPPRILSSGPDGFF